MIPSAWTFALLALAAFRTTRLLGWDTFLPVARVRARLLGEWVEARCSACQKVREDYELVAPNQWVGVEACPNCRSTEPACFVEGYDRPGLADLFTCAFCLGFWVSLAFYLAWLAAPKATLVAALPLALSAAVGLAAKNLDA